MAELHRVRACCEAGVYAGPRGVSEPITQPAEASTWRGAVLAEAVEVEPVRARHVAVHEAAHAVLAFGLGARIESVTIDGAPHCRWRSVEHDPAASVAIKIAGHTAENWLTRLIYRPSDAELGEFVGALKALRFGGCDFCQSMLSIVRIVGTDAPDAEFIAAYREVEVKVITIVREPNIWGAILNIADELMSYGTISGDRTHEIAEQHVRFGSTNLGD